MNDVPKNIQMISIYLMKKKIICMLCFYAEHAFKLSIHVAHKYLHLVVTSFLMLEGILMLLELTKGGGGGGGERR